MKKNQFAHTGILTTLFPVCMGYLLLNMIKKLKRMGLHTGWGAFAGNVLLAVKSGQTAQK